MRASKSSFHASLSTCQKPNDKSPASVRSVARSGRVRRMPKIIASMRARARCRTQNIDDDKKEQPDNVYKVPIPRGRFKPEMALRGEVTSQCAQQADQ